jgi:anion-transporting  ArsA/GET3 family ATPase
VRHLDLGAVLADRGTEIVICCGSGGVGKTTTSAALAVRAAESGRRVVVLTIDPARRLAQSLGIEQLDNIPRPVHGIDTTAGGSLDAMMLDMKRTFDDVVSTHATEEKAEAIFANPFYQALSTSFSGTQEYMAMEKLGQLATEATTRDRWDLIVVDTPPSRSALDFLDAPEHLSRLLDGRFLRLLLTPAKGPLRLMSVGFTLAYAAMEKVLGAQIITDVKTFAAAFETLFGGFRARAQQTLALLSSERTTFLVVATPEHDALREASFFVDRLTESGLDLSGVVVNRTHSSELEVSAERALALAEDLDDEPVDEPVDEAVDDTADGPGAGHADRDHTVEVAALRRHADRMRMIEREQRLLDRFSSSRPDVAITRVVALPSDVTDLPSLRRLGASLIDQQ